MEEREMANRATGKITVQAEMDRCGNIIARPVRDAIAWDLAGTAHENGRPYDLTCFFNEGGEASMFLEEEVPRRYHRDLENGWNVRWLADPENVCNWYGYDAFFS